VVLNLDWISRREEILNKKKIVKFWLNIGAVSVLITIKLIKLLIKKIMLKQEYRYQSKSISYHIRAEDYEVENLVIIVTEGEKGIEPCEVLSTKNGGVSLFGLGYIILKTNNNQKVQGEEVRWRIFFQSIIRKKDLEAGVEADYGLKEL
jgi:HJR/Mrr/RecB family endonuclease